MFFRRKSPENTNNNAEQAPSGSGAETEYPAFDPEAAKRRIAEYKAAHPNAVEDVGKAHAMAIAEDPYRTVAANARTAAKSAFEHAIDSDKRANNVNLETPKTYVRDSYTETLRYAEANLREGAKNYEKEAISFEEKAKKNDAIAEQRGQEAGIIYDIERVNPESEEEARQRRIAEYKAAHPNAVEDADKAYIMATAEDSYRTVAKEFRQRGKRRFKETREIYGSSPEAFGMELDSLLKDEKKAKQYDVIADEKGREAGMLYDAERLDPKTEEEVKQNRIANYKATHPDAIEDVDKARFMAEMGDAEETEAAELKKAAMHSYRESNNREFQEKVGGLSAQEIREESQKFLNAARQHREAAHRTEEEAGEFYDQMKDV